MMDMLACPMDGHYPLELHECKSNGDTVLVGAIFCTKCERFYPMRFTVSRVMPSRGEELSGGVEILPFFTIKIFSPVASLTYPS